MVDGFYKSLKFKHQKVLLAIQMQKHMVSMTPPKFGNNYLAKPNKFNYSPIFFWIHKFHNNTNLILLFSTKTPNASQFCREFPLSSWQRGSRKPPKAFNRCSFFRNKECQISPLFSTPQSFRTIIILNGVGGRDALMNLPGF